VQNLTAVQEAYILSRQRPRGWRGETAESFRGVGGAAASERHAGGGCSVLEYGTVKNRNKNESTEIGKSFDDLDHYLPFWKKQKPAGRLQSRPRKIPAQSSTKKAEGGGAGQEETLLIFRRVRGRKGLADRWDHQTGV